MISGTSLKLFLVADYLPENISNDIIFSSLDVNEVD
jgi:hypothetical protein